MHTCLTCHKRKAHLDLKGNMIILVILAIANFVTFACGLNAAE